LAFLVLDGLNGSLSLFFKVFLYNLIGEKILLEAIIIMVLLIVLSGYINARFPRIKNLHLTIDKTLNKKQDRLRIVCVSDVHLGSVIGEKRVINLVKMINQQNADLVLIAGDLLDEDPGPVIQQNLGACLEKIKSAFGVYAITGNHEHIGGISKAIDFLSNHHIRVLRDEAVLLNNMLYLVGREDRDARRFSNMERKDLSQLVLNLNHNKPIILMDHQPFHLDQSASSGVDLQVSGHTHHGQLWPFQFITKKIYQVSWGYLKLKKMHLYVSSGFGTWGPPVRIGNRPEIVVFNLKFKKLAGV